MIGGGIESPRCGDVSPFRERLAIPCRLSVLVGAVLNRYPGLQPSSMISPAVACRLVEAPAIAAEVDRVPNRCKQWSYPGPARTSFCRTVPDDDVSVHCQQSARRSGMLARHRKPENTCWRIGPMACSTRVMLIFMARVLDTGPVLIFFRSSFLNPLVRISVIRCPLYANSRAHPDLKSYRPISIPAVWWCRR